MKKTNFRKIEKFLGEYKALDAKLIKQQTDACRDIINVFDEKNIEKFITDRKRKVLKDTKELIKELDRRQISNLVQFFNPFDILLQRAPFKPNEDDHSDLLIALLDPGGKHGLETKVLKCLIEFVRKKVNDYQDLCDYILNQLSNKKYKINVFSRRKSDNSVIDILITGNEFAIFIENKMSGGSETVNKKGEKQTDREYRDSNDSAPDIDKEKKLFIFINPTGKPASCDKFITIDRYDMENIFLRIASGVNCVGIGDSIDTYMKMFLKFYADFYFRCI